MLTPDEAELETELARLAGVARVAPLLRLAQLRATRYTRLGPGSDAARAVLEPAIGNLREARGLVPSDDPSRVQLDSALGWLLAMRYVGHAGQVDDRDTAIDLLAASVDTAKLAPVQQQGALMMLGQLSALRALNLDPSRGANPMAQPMTWMTGGLPPRSRADLDRAHDCLTRVLRTGTDNDQMRQAAEVMLQLVTMMREMFGGLGQGDIMSNFNHLIRMMGRMSAGPASGGQFGQSPLWTPGAESFAVIEGVVGPGPATGLEAPPSAPPAAPAPPPVAIMTAPPAPASAPASDPLRWTLIDQLAAWSDSVDPRAEPDPVARLAGALLRPDTKPVAYPAADEAVALATAIRDGADRTGADDVLLAVTLWLRARADDGGGWAEDPGGSAATDRRDGLDSLLDAVSALPPSGSGAAAALSGVGAFLDGPLSPGLPAPVARRLLTSCDAVLGSRADRPGTIVGLREVCRAAIALTAGEPVDASAVDHAVDAVPSAYPWGFRLLAALGTARLADAAARGGPGCDGEPDADAARQARAAIGRAAAAAPGDGPMRALTVLADIAQAVLDGDDAALARHADRLRDDDIAGLVPESRQTAACLRHVLAEFGTGPTGTLPARAVGRLVALGRPVEALAAALACAGTGPAAAAGLRRLLVGWIGAILGAARAAPRSLADGVGAALRDRGLDRLVSLHPVRTGEDAGGLCTLTVDRDGVVLVAGVAPAPGRYDPAAPGDWGSRAGAVIAPALRPSESGPPRIVVTTAADLGALPWPAALVPDGTGGHRYPDEVSVLLPIRSVEHLLDPARGAPPPVDADPVFVANPAGDRDTATAEALTLRRIFYPRSTGLGRTVERVDGAGTAADVLAHLPGPAGPGASLLHLRCALRTAEPAAFGLAPGTGPAWLDLRRIAAQGRQRPAGTVGGMAVLPPDAATDGPALLAVADVLLEAGMSSVVHWLWPVPEPVAALMLYRLHAFLVDEAAPPADAVTAVRRWMRDPNRPAPRYLPAPYEPLLSSTDLAEPAMWAALSLRQ